MVIESLIEQKDGEILLDKFKDSMNNYLNDANSQNFVDNLQSKLACCGFKNFFGNL